MVNLSPSPETYVYTNLLGVIISQTLNVSQSIIVNSFSTPYSLSGGISVTNTGIDCFLTPTPTPTKTPTPTPSSTNPITSYDWTSGSSWWSTDTLACNNYISFASNGWTTSTSSPSIGDPLIDNGTNLPVTGHNNQWIGISSTSSPGVVVYAVAVDSNGTIIGVTVCP